MSLSFFSKQAIKEINAFATFYFTYCFVNTCFNGYGVMYTIGEEK